MKAKLFFAATLLTSSLFLFACGGNDKKESDAKEEKTESTVKDAPGDDLVPAIDTANLKDEASILDAMQKVADARIADEKKKKEDPAYRGNYLALTKLYTAVLKASTEYSKSLTDPAKAVEFNKKVSAIQDKMYQ